MDESVLQSILQRLTKIETLFEVDLKNVKEKVENDNNTMNKKIDDNYRNTDNRIAKIENNNTWLWRAIVLFILGLIATAITVTFK